MTHPVSPWACPGQKESERNVNDSFRYVSAISFSQSPNAHYQNITHKSSSVYRLSCLLNFRYTFKIHGYSKVTDPLKLSMFNCETIKWGARAIKGHLLLTFHLKLAASAEDTKHVPWVFMFLSLNMWSPYNGECTADPFWTCFLIPRTVDGCLERDHEKEFELWTVLISNCICPHGSNPSRWIKPTFAHVSSSLFPRALKRYVSKFKV